MTKRIYLSSPDVTLLEEQAVVRAMRSGWIAPLGPEVDAFEAELAQYNGREHCVALSSGTAALHLGLLTMGIGAGDLVITSSLTFAATVNAIVYTGAQPVLVDCDESGNISTELLARALDDLAEKSVRAVIPVDLLGKVADQGTIADLARAKGVAVLSDAAESLGAVRDGRPAGAYGDMAAISFNGNKVMTTSGGGALLTDDPVTAERVRYLAAQARQPVLHYEHVDVGYNYRLSNVLAALGRAQLARLDSMLERRRLIRTRYAALFADVPGVSIFGELSANVAVHHSPMAYAVAQSTITSTSGNPDRAKTSRSDSSTSEEGSSRTGRNEGGQTRDNCWLTSIVIQPHQAGFTPNELIDRLAAHNVEARPIWKPMHLQPVFAHAKAYIDGTAERLFRTGVSLPSGSALDDADLSRISRIIGDFLAERRHG